MKFIRRIFRHLFKNKVTERIQYCGGSLSPSARLTAIAKTSDGRTIAIRDNPGDREFLADYNGSCIQEKMSILKDISTIKGVKEEISKRFIKAYNPTYGTNFIISDKQPPIDSEVDVVLEDPMSGDALNLQIRVSDGTPWGSLARNHSFERSGNALNIYREAIMEAIGDKVKKYPEKLRQNLLLLLDGWPGVRQEDLSCLKNLGSEFLARAKFKEIWFIGITDDTIYRLFP